MALHNWGHSAERCSSARVVGLCRHVHNSVAAGFTPALAGNEPSVKLCRIRHTRKKRRDFTTVNYVTNQRTL